MLQHNFSHIVNSKWIQAIKSVYNLNFSLGPPSQFEHTLPTNPSTCWWFFAPVVEHIRSKNFLQTKCKLFIIYLCLSFWTVRCVLHTKTVHTHTVYINKHTIEIKVVCLVLFCFVFIIFKYCESENKGSLYFCFFVFIRYKHTSFH